MIPRSPSRSVIAPKRSGTTSSPIASASFRSSIESSNPLSAHLGLIIFEFPTSCPLRTWGVQYTVNPCPKNPHASQNIRRKSLMYKRHRVENRPRCAESPLERLQLAEFFRDYLPP